jgi:hypothetical protein
VVQERPAAVPERSAATRERSSGTAAARSGMAVATSPVHNLVDLPGCGAILVLQLITKTVPQTEAKTERVLVATHGAKCHWYLRPKLRQCVFRWQHTMQNATAKASQFELTGGCVKRAQANGSNGK